MVEAIVDEFVSKIDVKGPALVKEITSRLDVKDLDMVLDTVRTIQVRRLVEVLKTASFESVFEIVERVQTMDLSKEDALHLLDILSTAQFLPEEQTRHLKALLDSGAILAALNFVKKLPVPEPPQGCFACFRRPS